MKNRVALVLLALTVLFVAFVRIRLAAVPLERDEGEYAYMGQCLLNGTFPYTEAGNMKLPGTYFMYALLMAVFGQTATGIHLALLLVNLAGAGLLFLVARRWSDVATAAFASAIYLMLTMQPWVYGMAAHATHFVVLFGLAGILVLLLPIAIGIENQSRALGTRLFSAGALFGLAILMKQHAVFWAIFGSLILLENDWRTLPGQVKSWAKNQAVFGFGVVLPWLLVVLAAWATGSFDQFWHWTVEYAQAYAGRNPWSEGQKLFNMTFEAITIGALGWWLLAGAGVAALFFLQLSRQNRFRVLGLALFAFLSIVPGFYFRTHYFIAFFPGLALLAGLGLSGLAALAERFLPKMDWALPAALFIVLASVQIIRHDRIYYAGSFEEARARFFGRNPFAEAPVVAKFLESRTRPDERIVVFGSEPEIYFYAHRRAATKYLYTYPMMEDQAFNKTMQQDFRREIEQAKPRYLVDVNSQFSWLIRQNSDQSIMYWFESFTNENYRLVGFVDMIAPAQSRFITGAELGNLQPKGKENISIWERK